MTHGKPKAIHLKDYIAPDFLIDSVFLHFELREDVTHVKAILDIKRNSQAKRKQAPLVLNGEEMELHSILLNGKPLSTNEYRITKDSLIVAEVPKHFILETEVIIKPQLNTQLSGLYQSRGNFCTQCESHGFRRITYFLDRPDVMTRFTTTISADKKRYPVLLSNGNLMEQKDLANDRHWVKWEDPSLKPAYLFALVAGDLEWIEDKFITMSKREVVLRVYVEKGKLDQANFAMESLKKAMAWDEQRYGCEYDLNIYMIVAVSDFNMGAMENKGLNLFNDRYILVNQKTSTDADFLNVESVIGHEYFHNWSGNRVTVRDWFQITLKEGLTIFRDQNFSADLHSLVVQRIEDVNVIRTAQFAQDAGPLAHPIRPDSYIEVNNFYTVTVYNKGSEVIRMIETLLGGEKFRQGMELYFKRNDGHAVTTEEFIKAMEDAGHIDLKQFRRWYTQAGTPVLDVEGNYNAKQKTYHLTVKQSCPATPGQPRKQNFFMPLAVGLLDSKSGKDLLNPATQILQVKDKVHRFEFKNISEKPIPSLLRNFSAPVKLHFDYDDDDLLFLLTHDSDGFNRWDAGQKLASKMILALVKDYRSRRKFSLSDQFVAAIETLIADQQLDLQLLTEMLTLPKLAFLIELMKVADIEALHHAREFVKTELMKKLKKNFLQTYQFYQSNQPFHFNAKAIGERSLKNLCLAYLMQLDEAEIRELCIKQFQQADNMTDEIGALAALNNSKSKEREQALQQFYHKWQNDDLVINKWFSLQALSNLPNTLNKVKKLLKHPAFSYKNPNKVRALIGSFCQGNYINFHNISGSGYKFLGDQVLKIDKLNSQLSARIVEPLTHWRKFDKKRQKLMKDQLKRISKTPKLSRDVYELVTKSLRGGK